MEKSKIQQIVTFLNDVYEDICEGEASPMQLTELYRAIRLLMDETFKTQDQELKVLLASLEYRARHYKQTLEERLAVRN
jgi:hypothetical protein